MSSTLVANLVKGLDEIAQPRCALGIFGYTKEPIRCASGILSPVYIDNRGLLKKPDRWHAVIRALRRLQRILPDPIFGAIETAAIPHGAALAWIAEAPLCIIRKQVKDHGTKKRIDGASVVGQRVLVIEDHVTYAGSLLSAVGAVREAKGMVHNAISITSYGFPDTLAELQRAKIELLTHIRFDLLLRIARANKHLTPSQVRNVERWRGDPKAWTKRHEK